MTEPVLRISDFSVTLGGKTIVEPISFDLFPGKTFGLVGESGSGKSVSCLSMLRLLTAELKGSAILNNKNLTELPESEMPSIRGAEIAMIFQEPMTSLNPVYSCGTQVAEAIFAHQKISGDACKKRVLDLFAEVELPNPERIYKAYPHQLSGGQKQRVMIAMALSCNPNVLIADEPTTALDVTVQHKIVSLLSRLQKQYGMGMIFISHDLALVGEIADEIGVMQKGKMVEKGSPEKLFANASHPYTRGLLNCRPPVKGRPRRLPTVTDFINQNENHPDFTTERISNPPESTLLKAENLWLSYPAKKNLWGKPTEWFHALNDVSISIGKGETAGLVGESGCGKSSLGRCILRLQEPSNGRIFFNNKEITAIGQSELRRLRPKMQMIFQDPYASLNPRMTVGEAITEPLWVHKIYPTQKACKEATIELLEQVGLEADHAKRYPAQFSGGQRQRIGIARSIGLKPDFIVCDESVSALDVSVQAVVLNLLQDLKEKYNLTYLFISHDLSVVRYFCDRIIVMQKGKIVEDGSSDQVYYNPQNQYTKTLLEAIPKGKIHT
jgi:peptide/nickel transport system ATP-binding protein